MSRSLSLLIIAGCTAAPSTSAPKPARPVDRDPLAVERAAYDAARPVFERWCVRCHVPTNGSMSVITSDTFDISTYPFTGQSGALAGYHVADVLGTMFGDLDAPDGADEFRRPWAQHAPRMPKTEPGAVQGDDLALVRTWTVAWRAAHRAGLHTPAANQRPGE